MKFILYSLNYSPELTGIGKYNGEMCSELAAKGVDVTAITAPPYYPEWKVHSGFSPYLYKSVVSLGVKQLCCPTYVPSNVTTIKRFLHLVSFAFSSGLALFAQLFKKPDLIFLVQPTLFCAPMALLVGKLTGAKTIMHIQDFEVDAMFGLGMVSKGRISQFAESIECWLLKRFDVVSSISYSMLANAKRKGVRENKLLFLPNWADINFVTPAAEGNLLRREWGFTLDDKIVLYAGNIGKKQGLEIVLAAAHALESTTNVKFVLVGSGAYADTLKQMCEKRGLTNLSFKPLQPWERVPEMLSMADVHLVVQKKGAADAVLPSKLTNILAAGGHALVTAESHTELGQLAIKHPGIFEVVEPESEEKFIAGLKKLLVSDLGEYNKVARSYAENFLDKRVILERFSHDIESLVSEN